MVGSLTVNPSDTGDDSDSMHCCPSLRSTPFTSRQSTGEGTKGVRGRGIIRAMVTGSFVKMPKYRFRDEPPFLCRGEQADSTLGESHSEFM
jgi:hypothetical protein